MIGSWWLVRSVTWSTKRHLREAVNVFPSLLRRLAEGSPQPRLGARIDGIPRCPRIRSLLPNLTLDSLLCCCPGAIHHRLFACLLHHLHVARLNRTPYFALHLAVLLRLHVSDSIAATRRLQPGKHTNAAAQCAKPTIQLARSPYPTQCLLYSHLPPI